MTLASCVSASKFVSTLVTATALVMAFSVPVCGQSSTQFPAQNSNADIGKGYDSLSGTATDRCVEYSGDPEKDLTKQVNDGQKGHIKIVHTTSSDELASALDFGVAASFGFGTYSGDLSVNYSHSTKVNRYSESLVIDVAVETQRRLLKTIRLSGVGTEAAKSGPAAFFLSCGDQYIEGWVEGGSFTAAFTATSSTNSEQEEERATLHAASAGTGNIDSNVQKKMEVLRQDGKLTMDVTRQGPNEKFPGATVLELVKYALDFPEKINGKNSWTIKYLTSDYRGLVNFGSMTPEQRRVSNKLANYVRALYYRRSGLSYIKDHPKQFPPFDQDRAKLEIDALTQKIQDVAGIAFGCASDSGACSEPTYEKVPSLPPRIEPAIGIDPKNSSWTYIGSSIGTETKVVSVEGSWYAHCAINNTVLQGLHQVGENDSLRFVNIKTGAESFGSAAKPMLVPPDSYVYYRVADGAKDYGDNCTEGLRASVFEPVFADEYRPMHEFSSLLSAYSFSKTVVSSKPDNAMKDHDTQTNAADEFALPVK